MTYDPFSYNLNVGSEVTRQKIRENVVNKLNSVGSVPAFCSSNELHLGSGTPLLATRALLRSPPPLRSYFAAMYKVSRRPCFPKFSLYFMLFSTLFIVCSSLCNTFGFQSTSCSVFRCLNHSSTRAYSFSEPIPLQNLFRALPSPSASFPPKPPNVSFLL